MRVVTLTALQTTIVDDQGRGVDGVDANKWLAHRGTHKV